MVSAARIITIPEALLMMTDSMSIANGSMRLLPVNTK